MLGPMRTPVDVFTYSPLLKEVEVVCHRTAIRLRSRRWTKPISYLPWAGWMMATMSLNPVVGRRLPAALLRQAFWQTWRRTARRTLTVRMPSGYRLALPPWSNIAGLTFATGMHEPREELFALAYLRPGDVAVDVGANIGIFSALMASTGAGVIAFEPGSRSRSDLGHTIALNPDMIITVVPAALSDEGGQMRLTLDLESSNHLVEEESNGSYETVDVMRLDDYLADNPAQVAFVKIDAEGFDLQVLKGAEDLLATQQPVLMVETWGPPDVRFWLEEHGYRIYRYAFEDRTLYEYPRPHNHQANILAVHDARLKDVQERLSTAMPPSLKLPRIEHFHGQP